MSYTAIDHIIQPWADANGFKLHMAWAGEEARFCYLSSQQGECYQISIERPENELVRVHVRAVETLDDMEAHLEWFVSIAELGAVLEVAHKTVRDCLWNRQPAYRLW